MCGIAAFISTSTDKKIHFINASHELQHHRGPDSRGEWQDENIALAHQRLSILDLSVAGHQPMASLNGRYVMVFNGEIYNHLELRAKYFPNHHWRGHSDTETLLALFEKFNTDMFPLLIGMWAIGIWDKEEKKLLISRDRYGQKPLYYRFYKGGSFGCSSEIKPLLIPNEKNKANALMVAEFLALGNYGHLDEQTFFAEVSQLLPGTYAWVSVGQDYITPKQYWKIPSLPNKEKKAATPKEIQELRDLLVDAVKSQTLSDVPLGASLSGGLDSSVIVGILASGTNGENPISVFTAQTPGSRWDESIYVKHVSDMWGGALKIYAKDMNEIRLSTTLEQTLRIQEEPFGDPSIIAHGFLMDMAKDSGIKVVLGGQGSDEIFRGYHHSVKQLFSHELRRLNLSFALREMKYTGFGIQEKLRILLGAVAPEVEMKLRYQSRTKRKFFMSAPLREAAGSVDMKAKLAYACDWEAGLRESITSVHLPHLVHYDDRNGMARSIEGRMPFLDHRILEKVVQFKSDEFFKHGLSKSLVRKAGREFIPDIVYHRRDKLGFFTPLQDMMKEEFSWIENHLQGFDWVSEEVIQNDLNYLRGLNHKSEDSERLWRTLATAVWAKNFNVTL